MPYPILTLPYPFATRLRHLLSPPELQDLQIAAGHNGINTLKPFVPLIQDYDGVRLDGSSTIDPHTIDTCQAYRGSKSNHNLFISTDLIDIRRDSGRYCIETLALRNMSNIALKNLNLKIQQIKLYHINIGYSHITNDLLKTVAKTTVGCEYLSIYNSQFDEDITIDTILDIFPCLDTLMLNYAYRGWLNDLTNAKKELEFSLRSDNFEKLFSFRPEELFDFVAKQGPEFRIFLWLETADPGAIFKAKPFIDPRFQRVDPDSDDYNFAIRIWYKRSGYMYRTQYVLPTSTP